MEPCTKNFPVEELRCGCEFCNKEVPNDCDVDALEALQRVRDDVGFAMSLTSAHRCERHPAERDKDRPGDHYHGIGFDVFVPWGPQRGAILEAAIKHGFTAFGFAETFIHLGYRDQDYISTWGY